MPDIIITPNSGIIDFFPVSTRVGRIEGSGNTINISNPSGYIAASGSGLSINTSSPNATLHAFSSVSGATLFNLEGTNGSLFSVVDNLSGSLMSVNNNAGLPVFEVFSDDRIIGGRFGQNDFVMTSGGNIGIGTGVPSSKFHVVGTSTFGGDISSTGSFIAGSGSASNPSFEFNGDTDTGMFAPSTNTLAFSTSGVERLRINDVGRLGISNTNPTSLLTISTGIGSSVNVNTTNGYAIGVYHSGIRIITPEDTNSNSNFTSINLLISRAGAYQGGTASIDFDSRDRGNNFDRGIMARIAGGNAPNTVANQSLGGYLTFDVAASGSGTPSTRMVISRDGYVGIGTTSPSSQLHTVGTGVITSKLGVGTVAPSAILDISQNDAILRIADASSNTNVGPRVQLDSTFGGNIGSAYLGFSFYNNKTYLQHGRANTGGIELRSANGTSRIYIQDSNGYVGIGTGVQATTPPEMLTVDGNLRLADKSGSTGNKIQFNRGGGTANDYTIGKEGNHLAISTASDSTTQRYIEFGYHTAGGTWTPKTRINGFTGEVAINNTSTPSGALDVGGDVYIRGTGNNLGIAYFKSQAAGDKTLYLGATNGGDLVLNGGGANIQLSSQGGYLNLLGSSTQIHIGHGANFGNTTQIIRFLPAATEMMRMTTSGTVGIGLPTSSASYAGNAVQLFSSQPYANTRVHIAGSGSTSASAALIVTNSGIDPILYVRNDRTVGINTNSPSGQLHVVGSGIFSSGVYINNIGITGNMVFATNTNGNLIIKPNGNGALQADNTGNSRGLYSVDLQRSRASVSGVCAGDYSVIVGGNNNRCSSTNSIVVGGNNNTCSGYTSTIGGGGLNTNTSEYGVIAGGVGNTAAGLYGSCVGGGYYNTSSGYAATVAGGRNNNSTNNYSSIGGGINNTSSGSNSTVGGGYNNTASSTNSTVGGGNNNTASSTNSTVCGGTFNTASNGYCTVTGGRSNTSSNMYATVGGGYVNTASGAGSTVGGGKTNTASGYCSAIAGGISNNASGSQSAVCGGSSNTVSGTCSTVGGGTFNTSSGSYSTVTGGKECVSHQYGEEARSSGKFVDNGDAQVRKLLMRGKTNVTNNTVLLTLDGSLKDISTIDNSCIISHHRYDANDSSKQYTWLYNIKVVARHISATTPTSAAYKFEGILESSSAAGVILLGNTKTVIYEDNADFDCNIYEYNTNSAVRTDGLYIEVSNSLSADEDIYWVAYVEILEVGITEYDTPAY